MFVKTITGRFKLTRQFIIVHRTRIVPRLPRIISALLATRLLRVETVSSVSPAIVCSMYTYMYTYAPPPMMNAIVSVTHSDDA